MSQSPTKETQNPQQGYLDAWQDLATRIRNGNSFSGREPNSAFLNTRGERFADLSLMSGLGLPDDGRALAVTDWDRDGDLDFWVSNRTAPRVRLLRNDYLTKPRTVSLRLQGDPSKRVPRDAIGAVVTLALSDKTVLTRQVTAGEGFLSQSSKWLHFGLGAKNQVASIEVRWPGTPTPEKFVKVGNGRWHLRQGAGKGTPDQRKPVVLADRPLTRPEPQPEIVTRLTEPQPAPILNYRTWSGDRALVDTQPLTLTLLWASWCQPCLREMKLLAQQQAALKSAGVTVFALNIEEAQAELEGAEAPNAKTLEASLKKLSWPFASGRASTELVQALDKAQRSVLYKQEALPLPSSFLWYRGGLLSFAKGSVSVDSIVAEAKRVAQAPSKHPDHAVPFAGRWSTDHFVTHPVAIARVYLEGAYYADGRRYLEESLAALSEPDPAKQRLQEADIQHMIGESYRLENAAPNIALPHYERAVRLHPQHPQAPLSYAKALTALRRGKDAVAVLKSFLKAAPERQDARVQLGNVYQSLGENAEAAAMYEGVLKAKPGDFEALNQLCWVLSISPKAAHRNPKRALALAQQILQRYGNHPQALDTAAAAFANAQQFDKAIPMVQRALTIAQRQRSSAPLAKELQARLALYQQSKPYHR